MRKHVLRMMAAVGLIVALGAVLASQGPAAGPPPEQTQKLKDVKPDPVENVGDKANKIDNPTEELEPSTPEACDPVGGGKIKIISKTFLPPGTKKFTTFPDGTWVDVERDPDSLTINKNVDGKNTNARIKVSATETVAGTAGQFPMKCEGNLTGTGTGGNPPHWSAKVSGMTASESVTMTAYGFSSAALAAGTTGTGGTSYSEGQVILTQGGNSGAGSIAISVSATWEKRGEMYAEATLNAPSLWVSKQANGIDATVTLTNINVTYYNFWLLGYTDTGTSPPMTLTMEGANTANDVTGTWTSPPAPTVLTFGAAGITYTFSGIRSVTINSH
jgi:hypothetical protein